MTSETVLVTGAAGFIGSTLVDTLLARGRDVAGIDSFEPFYPRAAKERNLEAARASSAFRFLEVDTRDRDGLSTFVREIRPTTIVDLAARAGVRDSLRDPWLYIDINVVGLQNLLAAVAEVGASLVFASSSSVYGSAVPIPFREDAAPLRPASPYGATKVAGEAMLAAHHGLTGLPTRIARLFTVYGPRQRPDLAVRKFAEALLDDRTIPLYDNGAGTRDYTFVGDVVDGLTRLVDAPHPQLTVNLGGGRPYATIDVLRALEQMLERRASIEALSKQPGDAIDTAADISRARDELGWEPRTSLDPGLRQFGDWLVADRATSEGQAAASD